MFSSYLFFLCGSVTWDVTGDILEHCHSPESSTFFSWGEIEGHLEQLAVVITLALAVNLETKQAQRRNVIINVYVTS